LLDVHLERIDRHNQALNAVITVDGERARTRAQAADKALAHALMLTSGAITN
jgi:amidase